uniref:Uncharacterized protein n=1 Tax=Anguilla anguilla TaxID=7936 RepID=A0A0E9QIA4_ANGAN
MAKISCWELPIHGKERGRNETYILKRAMVELLKHRSASSVFLSPLPPPEIFNLNAILQSLSMRWRF